MLRELVVCRTVLRVMVATVPKSVKRRRGARRSPTTGNTLESTQVECDMLKTEIERLTADLVITRRKLRAERFRTRRLVDVISRQAQQENRAKKSAPVLELGESAEAVAVLVAQQRFKSQSRVH